MVFTAAFFAFGALCLLSLFASQRQRRMWRAVLPMAVLSVLAYGIAADQIGERRKSFADTSTSHLIRGAIYDLHRAFADPQLRHILLVDGGSYPARGLDGRLLESLLERDTGRRYAVVQLTLSGANHFERHEAFRVLIRELDALERDALAARDVTLLLEVQRGYDMTPLAQFTKAKFTARAYEYLTPSNALIAAWTEWKYSSVKNRWKKIPLLGEILAHALGRPFHRGKLFPLERLPAQTGYSPLSYVTDHFRGMAAIKKRLSAVTRTKTAPWVDEVRTPRLRRLLRGLIDRVEFYSVPTPYPEYGAYARRFCRDHPEPCIDYTDPTLLTILDDPLYWADKGHLSRKGAELYTHWFAARYLADHR